MVGLVPDWMRLLLMQARLTPDVLDVLLLHRMPLNIPVDHADLPSAHLTSRPIRQVMYGLLLGEGRQHQVMERDRDGLQLTFIPVHPAFTRLSKQLKVNSLDEVKLLGFYSNCHKCVIIFSTDDAHHYQMFHKCHYMRRN